MLHDETKPAIVFDFGGVLITPITHQISVVANQHGVSLATMLEILMGPHKSSDHPWHRAERGEIDVCDIQPNLGQWASAQGVTLHGDEIAALLRPGAYTVIESMLAKVTQLTAEGYKTALLTNTFSYFQATMDKDIDFSRFTAVVESFAIGARKPEAAMYEATARILEIEHGDIIYLDDFAQNIVAAQEFGWTTIHVHDPHQALMALEELLLM